VKPRAAIIPDSKMIAPMPLLATPALSGMIAAVSLA